MVTRAMGTQWHREEWKGREDELETREQCEIRRGLEEGAVNSRFYDYADVRPESVKSEGRTLFYVKSEMDEFLDGIINRGRTRTTAEKMWANVVRCEATVKSRNERLEAQENRTAKCRRERDAAVAKLSRLKRQYEIEVNTGG